MKSLVPVLLAALPALSLAAVAPERPASADLADLLRQAAASSPAIRAAEARALAARRAPSQAQAPPDPEVSLSYINDGISRFTLGQSEFSTLSITWTQEFRYPGKLAGAGEVASLDAERAGKEFERVRLLVAATVKTAYAELYRLDRTRSILEESRSTLETFSESARKRYEVGEGIQESVLKAQTGVLRLEAEIARVVAALKEAGVKDATEIAKSACWEAAAEEAVRRPGVRQRPAPAADAAAGDRPGVRPPPDPARERAGDVSVAGRTAVRLAAPVPAAEAADRPGRPDA